MRLDPNMRPRAIKPVRLIAVMAVTFSLCIVPATGYSDESPENQASERAQLSLATFDVDATPDIGFAMAYDPVRRVDELGLRCRGIVLMGSGKPIVMCAVDWIGIGNQSQDVFRQRIATAAGTDPSRVVVHTLHQHDAPRCDFGAESLLNQVGSADLGAHDGAFARRVIDRLTTAIRDAVPNATPITHAGIGTADVEKVASNRRIQDETGKVVATRYTATRDAKLRALPEGTIDRQLTSLSFWNQDKPMAVLTYYACHPQSYYRTGIPSPDFPGIARFMMGQSVPTALHVHFNGAGGNIGAGKYNDGSHGNRMVLANRIADAMTSALANCERFPIGPNDVSWSECKVALPPAVHLNRETLTEQLSQWGTNEYFGAPDELAWLLRCESGYQIPLSCLSVGKVRVLHMPGELFVEYQLAAKAMRPDLHVAMAAYGDYGPGYIGTEAAYGQGGYETSQKASNVAPETEQVLMDGMRVLLDAPEPKE
ncbi:hypothetical protein K227x_25010 [Rubripirellula lacrimiformis]|uniref:Neutral/alkaline non-lysosomal ceramidase n=1 Tax=Rubripirellula lacrimiformis TaxID=1930273 RepID=A0A517NAF2_9BACT|nr:hypothetical protein [Rubripirellula lacrimiformis]QDT04113.1 hypothetical protein K227x_25010 [Rubripirellula lacrimiformis]